MEGQMEYEKYVKLMSLAFDSNANIAPYDPEDDPNQHFLPEAGTNENHSNAPPLPQWMYSQQTPHNYIEFLAENSTYDHKASFSHVPEGISLPVGSIHYPNGVSGIQSEVLNNESGKAHSFEPTVSNLDMVSWNVMPSLHFPNSNSHVDLISGAGFEYSSQNEIGDRQRCSDPMVRYLKPHNERKPLNNFTNPQLHAQINTTLREQVNKDNYHVYEPQPGVKVAAPEIQSKPHNSSRGYTKERTMETERHRRLKIAERLKALQELLPQSTEASQVSVMDDVIEYIKYLQFQMKELSRNRLGGKLTSDPFISLERYGHNLINEQMQNEPLEEIIGNMLEVNPSAATKLLESRGLWVMPMALAEDLLPGHTRMRPNTPF